MTPLLTISDLHLAHGAHTLLHGIDLTLQAGEVVSILGSNGAGKSSLLKCILGLHETSASQRGDIRLFGLHLQRDRAQVLSRVAYVPEQPAVYGHLNAIENLVYFLHLAQVPTIHPPAHYLQRVGLAEASWHQPCSRYSKGMKQKVMLALALAKQAQLLLLDEPNTGLDPQATDELNQLIIQCKHSGMAVLAVTHDVISAMAFSDRMLMLTKGQLQPVCLNQTALTLDTLQALYRGQA